MGVYTVLEPFTRKTNGSNAVMRPGTKIRLDLRSEAEALLGSGKITRENNPTLKVAPAPTGEKVQPKQARYTPEERQAIEVFAKAAGLKFDGAAVKIKSKLDIDNPSIEEAIYLVRKSMKMLSKKELIEEAAEALDEPEDELQAEIEEFVEENDVTVFEAIEYITIGRECEQEAALVMQAVAELVDTKSFSKPDAIAQMRKDWAKTENENDDSESDEEEVEGIEIEGRTFVEGVTRVRVVEEDEKWAGRIGTVIKITKGGTFHVELDEDEAQYRQFDDDRLVKIEDKENNPEE